MAVYNEMLVFCFFFEWGRSGVCSADYNYRLHWVYTVTNVYGYVVLEKSEQIKITFGQSSKGKAACIECGEC